MPKKQKAPTVGLSDSRTTTRHSRNALLTQRSMKTATCSMPSHCTLRPDTAYCYMTCSSFLFQERVPKQHISCCLYVLSCVTATCTRRLYVMTCVTATCTRRQYVLSCVTATRTRRQYLLSCVTATCTRRLYVMTCVTATCTRRLYVLSCVTATCTRRQ